MRLLIRAALLALAVLSAAPARAQAPVPCGDPAAIVARLGAAYREAVTARGVDAGGRLVLVFSNPATGTWTVLLASPGGPACIVSSGEGWEAVDYLPPPAGGGLGLLTG